MQKYTSSTLADLDALYIFKKSFLKCQNFMHF